MLYGLPCGLDKLQDLKRLAAEMGKSNAVLRLMIDHPDQIRALGGIANPNGAWSIFIKVDGGGK
jgi:D-serine deaminase-like pyridoxal phosphate-dependent protein